MRFRRLRLSGFKSFVEPAELHIEPGLTGVVGPNGCGKSNLLEAIRWVMGESSPKSMRGAGMEDIIFAGTETRPPRGFAEVVLLAETDAGQEMEVVRRIERGAGSAYRLNGRDVRAKDIALMFADAATGAHSPALVSQGRIAAVIAARPAERRQMLEEAAGISGLHVRRRDAELKLRATENNLARLDDLIAQLDSRLAALRRQARTAERYREISAEIRLAEARLVYARWRDAAAAADAARAEAEAAERTAAQMRGATDAAQTAQRKSAEALAAARETVADRRDDLTAQANLLAVANGRLEAAEERLADLDRQRTRLESDAGEADRTTRDAAEALSRIERDLVEAEREIAGQEAARPALAARQEDAERAQRAAELALAQASAEQARIEADWRVADAAVAQAQGAVERLLREKHEREAKRAELGGADGLARARDAAEARCAEAAKALEEARERLNSARENRETASARRDETGNALAAAKAGLTGLKSEYEALCRDRDAKAVSAGANGRRAIDAIRAEPGYERALAAVLGRDAAALLGAPVGQEDGQFWTGATPPPTRTDSLSRQVGDAPDELAARLALVRFAERDDGQALDPGEWLVTRDGALRRWDGFVARGDGAAEAARLEAANRLEALSAQLPDRERALETAQAEYRRAEAALNEAGEARGSAERAMAAAADEERSALRARDQAENAYEQALRIGAEIDERIADLDARLEAGRAELDEAERRRGELPPPDAQRSAYETARARSDAAREALQSAMAALAALEQGLAVGRERGNAMRGDIRGWQARAGDAAKRLAGMNGRREEIEEERRVLAAKPDSLAREIAAAEQARDRLTSELEQAEAAMAIAQGAAGEADAAFADITDRLGSAREARAGAAARAEGAETRREEAARLSGERFQCPPPLLPQRAGFDGRETGSAEAESEALERLSASRERLGPVNLVAADELAEARAEHGASAAEQAELAEAVNRLRGSIGSLNREGRERLRKAFEAVDGHFRSLFKTLFGGGQAHLALIDSEDPLEAGLEIYAQPPGKKLQSLSLLSGGEQALTAIALIFALFLTNPAPICVLDEVDAPLDDANVERFCDLLDAMVMETSTRYLIVTHNAVTMSRMHRLFGVTMIERGISRLVSVDLGGAEELLAAE